MDGFAQRLCSAADTGDALVVRKLLRRFPNFDINCCGRDTCGRTALSKAAKNGHSEVVGLLLEAGADVNVCDALLVTPLHLAALGGHTEVVKLLLHYGAKIEMRTKNGMTPMDFAGFDTESWRIMHIAEYGILPELPPQTDVVPVIPWYALTLPMNTDKNKISAKKDQKDEKKKTSTKKDQKDEKKKTSTKKDQKHGKKKSRK